MVRNGFKIFSNLFKSSTIFCEYMEKMKIISGKDRGYCSPCFPKDPQKTPKYQQMSNKDTNGACSSVLSETSRTCHDYSQDSEERQWLFYNDFS